MGCGHEKRNDCRDFLDHVANGKEPKKVKGRLPIIWLHTFVV
jgi:hypothetical protein